MVRRRALVLLVSLGIPALLIMAVAALWGPDLLIPLVESTRQRSIGAAGDDSASACHAGSFPADHSG